MDNKISIPIKDANFLDMQTLCKSYDFCINGNFMSTSIIQSQSNWDTFYKEFTEQFGNEGLFVFGLPDKRSIYLEWYVKDNDIFTNYKKRESINMNRWIQSGGTLD